MHTIKTTSFSHIGQRDEQQDAVKIWSTDDTILIVLADGVGGNVGGAAASQAAIQCAEDYWEKSKGQFTSPEKELTSIAQAAHEAIRDLLPNEKRSPSSTLVALYIDKKDTMAHWVHCGDSRLYRIRNGEEITRTRDHSVVQLLLEQGKITEDELATHPDKGRILKSLGASKFKGVDYDSCKYQSRDVFLLCSDGYWESIPPKEDPLPLKPTKMSLDDYAESIVNKAVKRNGDSSDNTTIAIAYVQPNASENTSSQEQHESTQEIANSTQVASTFSLINSILAIIIVTLAAIFIYMLLH